MKENTRSTTASTDDKVGTVDGTAIRVNCPMLEPTSYWSQVSFPLSKLSTQKAKKAKDGSSVKQVTTYLAYESLQLVIEQGYSKYSGYSYIEPEKYADMC